MRFSQKMKRRFKERLQNRFADSSKGCHKTPEDSPRRRKTPNFPSTNPPGQPAAKRQKTASTPTNKPSAKEMPKGTNTKLPRPKAELSEVDREIKATEGQMQHLRAEMEAIRSSRGAEKKKRGGLLVIGDSVDSMQRKELKKLERKCQELKEKRASVARGTSAVGDDVASNHLAGMGGANQWEASGNQFAM